MLISCLRRSSPRIDGVWSTLNTDRLHRFILWLSRANQRCDPATGFGESSTQNPINIGSMSARARHSVPEERVMVIHVAPLVRCQRSICMNTKFTPDCQSVCPLVSIAGHRSSAPSPRQFRLVLCLAARSALALSVDACCNRSEGLFSAHHVDDPTHAALCLTVRNEVGCRPSPRGA